MKTLNNKKLLQQVAKGNFKAYPYARITLAETSTQKAQSLILTPEKDFLIEGNSYSESLGSGFPLGSAICKTITLTIDNHDERFSKYDFRNAKIGLTSIIESNVNGEILNESVIEGQFTVIDSVTPGSKLEITAYDDMYKADVKYISGVGKGANPLTLLEEICNRCGITLDDSFRRYIQNTFNTDTPICHLQNIPIDCTGRELIGYIAMVCGGNAFIRNGYLTLQRYSVENQKKIYALSGGRVDDDLTFDTQVRSGNINTANSEILSDDDYKILNISSNPPYHILHSFINEPDISTEQVKVTGISTNITVENSDNVEDNETSENTDENIILFGTDEYALHIDNPLYYGIEKTLVAYIGNQIVGFSAKAFSGEFSPNPLITFGDSCIVIDRKNNMHVSFITNHTFNYLGNSEISNEIETTERNKSTYSNDTHSLQIEQRKQTVTNQKYFNDIEKQFANASGMFFTKEEQENGSYKYFLHDKTKKEDSTVVMEIASEGLIVFVDGQKTIALSVDGQAILNQIIADGITADVIKGATFKVGGTTNEEGAIEIYNTSSEVIGTIDSDGVTTQRIILKRDDSVGVISVDSETNRLQIEVPENFGFFSRKGQTGSLGKPILTYNNDTLLTNNTVNITQKATIGELEIGDITIANKSGIAEVNGEIPFTGTFEVATELTTSPEGLVTNRKWKNLRFVNGILVGTYE